MKPSGELKLKIKRNHSTGLLEGTTSAKKRKLPKLRYHVLHSRRWDKTEAMTVFFSGKVEDDDFIVRVLWSYAVPGWVYLFPFFLLLFPSFGWCCVLFAPFSPNITIRRAYVSKLNSFIVCCWEKSELKKGSTHKEAQNIFKSPFFMTNTSTKTIGASITAVVSSLSAQVSIRVVI